MMRQRYEVKGDEVFIPCETVEDVKAVQSMNTGVATERLRILRKELDEQGEVQEQDLPYRKEEFEQALEEMRQELEEKRLASEVHLKVGRLEIHATCEANAPGTYLLDGEPIEGASRIEIYFEACQPPKFMIEYLP